MLNHAVRQHGLPLDHHYNILSIGAFEVVNHTVQLLPVTTGSHIIESYFHHSLHHWNVGFGYIQAPKSCSRMNAQTETHWNSFHRSTSAVLHTVKLTGLKPSTTYFYTCGKSNKNLTLLWWNVCQRTVEMHVCPQQYTAFSFYFAGFSTDHHSYLRSDDESVSHFLLQVSARLAPMWRDLSQPFLQWEIWKHRSLASLVTSVSLTSPLSPLGKYNGACTNPLPKTCCVFLILLLSQMVNNVAHCDIISAWMCFEPLFINSAYDLFHYSRLLDTRSSIRFLWRPYLLTRWHFELLAYDCTAHRQQPWYRAQHRRL